MNQPRLCAFGVIEELSLHFISSLKVHKERKEGEIVYTENSLFCGTLGKAGIIYSVCFRQSGV